MTPAAKQMALVGPQPLPSPPFLPPPTFLDLLPILLLVGSLDAVDLTTLALCSRELRRAVDEAWMGVRARNPTTNLRSVERCVSDVEQNKSTLSRCAPVSQAGACVACKTLTRLRNPIEGSLLCAGCTTASNRAVFTSPLFRFRLVDETIARNKYSLSNQSLLGKHLPFAHIPAVANVVDLATARSHASGRAQQGGAAAANGPRMFLLRDVVALVLEKWGGAKLLQERIRFMDMPLLNLEEPDA
jgi:hypothetical protein